MTDAGLIWRGSYNRLRPTVWKYSQFERDILDCALYMMNEVGKTRATARNDPVVICRVLSAAVSKTTRRPIYGYRSRRNFNTYTNRRIIAGELSG